MSRELQDLVIDLIGILEEQARYLGRLQDAMTKTRGAFTSVGARRLQAGVEGLEEHSTKLMDLESRRSQIVADLQRTLGLGGEARVSRIKPRLPARLARQLQQAADSAGEAARRLRVECQVGTRLLSLSEEANIGIIESLLGLSRDGNTSYDRNARSQSTDMPGGNLISGTA
jgi:hypothetical protein